MNLAHLMAGRLRLRHVYVATAIAKFGSVRAASEALHLTQPATSRTLRDLEAALEVKMFERTARGMALTADGTDLLPHLQFLVSEVSALERHAAELASGNGGDVRIGTLLAGSADVLPDAILELRREFPGIRLRIVEATPTALHLQLMLGEIDVILGRVEPLGSLPGVTVEPLFEDWVNIICSSDHPRSTGDCELSELVEESWVLPPAETSLRQQVDRAFIAASGTTPTDTVECVAPVPLRSILLRSQHLGVVPSGIFADDISSGVLVLVPVALEGTFVPVGLMTRTGGDLPASARSVIETIRSCAAGHRKPLQISDVGNRAGSSPGVGRRS